MLNEKLFELITATGEMLDLEGSVIEKDYYVTQVIHALAEVESDYFRLIFCGGTCLAKAHKVVCRMSEDVDFKIQVKKRDAGFSKSQTLKELKKFRAQINSSLMLPGLVTGIPVVRNEGKYSRIEMNYPSVFPVNAGLRPHILLEFTLSDVRLAVENLSVKTLIEQTLENINLFKSSSTHCVSVNETAIEKWVGLTRRIAAIERAYHADDETLIRHVYDLNAINKADRISADFYVLAKAIITNDARQFKNQHPEYAVDPSSEIQLSLSLLRHKPLWKERYQKFIEEMVYDNAPAIEYEKAINVLERISTGVIDTLSQ
ncbi:TPA: nucleotidyl transferase AbiEii/AbiGii toxin family protein [Legionella pneumophila]|nr:nucleotidyl transferase AbiEii/AbiGii toxin family protein [Legionella pneumophila]